MFKSFETFLIVKCKSNAQNNIKYYYISMLLRYPHVESNISL